MRFAVLGSDGQIGIPLCNHLMSRGHEVLAVDIKRDAHTHDLRKYPHSENSGMSWPDAIERSDFVFFLAYDVGGAPYLQKHQHTAQFLENNMKIMLNVFSVLEREKKPFIFASSQMSNMVNSPYGVSKLLGESYTRSLGGVFVKLWNIYGPENEPEKFHVITDMILSARDQRVISLMTTGQEERQFLSADDCATCLLTLAESYSSLARDKSYHITSFEWVKVIDVANMIRKCMSDSSLVSAPISLYCQNTLDVTHGGIKNEPDPHILKYYWRPSVSLEDGIRKMCHYYTNGPGMHIRKRM